MSAPPTQQAPPKPSDTEDRWCTCDGWCKCDRLNSNPNCRCLAGGNPHPNAVIPKVTRCACGPVPPKITGDICGGHGECGGCKTQTVKKTETIVHNTAKNKITGLEERPWNMPKF